MCLNTYLSQVQLEWKQVTCAKDVIWKFGTGKLVEKGQGSCLRLTAALQHGGVFRAQRYFGCWL